MQKIAVIALIKKDDKILLVNHFQRGWDIPGGYVKDTEDLITAVSREILEETGLSVHKLKLKAIYSNLEYELVGDQKATKLIFGFACEYLAGKIQFSRETENVLFIEKKVIGSYVTDVLQKDRIYHLMSENLKYYAYSKNPYILLSENEL
jgi:8-oxo-dGTP diphosphatase